VLGPSNRALRARSTHWIEASHEDLQAEIKELRERQHYDEWTIGGLIAHMDGMEARMAFLQAQVAALIPTPAMDLSREENEGIVGDLMMTGLSRGRESLFSFVERGAIGRSGGIGEELGVP